MKSRFDDFIEKIPKSIHNKTRTFIGSNIAVFIPEDFVIGKAIVNRDYHFVIFHSTPPITRINNREYKLRSGTLLCMSPGTEIIVEAIVTKSQAKYIAININREFLENILSQVAGHNLMKPVIYNNHYSYKTLDQIEFFMQEFIYLEDPSPLMIESLETQIVIQLLRDLDLDPITKRINPDQENSYVNQAIIFIESYYNSNISIKEISDSIYISPCHFQRLFKKKMNKTPYQYILDFRLKKAKERLEKENISISEVGRLCGFSNSGHFCTVFKKSEGITPLQYRNSLKCRMSEARRD